MATECSSFTAKAIGLLNRSRGHLRPDSRPQALHAISNMHPRPPSPGIRRPIVIAILIAITLFGLFVALLLTALVVLGDGPSLERTGQFGDSFGVMNCLFTGLAFAALIVSLVMQRHDLQASLYELNSLVGAAQSELRGQAHERLYQHNAQYVSMLAANPQLRPVFYENGDLDALKPKQKARALLVAELLLGYLETIALELRAGVLDSDVADHWKAFLRDVYRDSPALRQQYIETGSWYVPELREYFGIA